MDTQDKYQEFHDPVKLIRQRLVDFDASGLSDFAGHIRAIAPESVLAIVLYGSRLNAVTASESSIYDFFVVVNDYPGFFPHLKDRLLARVLPPSVYRLKMTTANGKERECKYCVVSKTDLLKNTSQNARDFYLSGRFSKRMGLVWSKDDDTLDTVAQAAADALEFLAPHALAMLNSSFTLEDFSRQILLTSYLGEIRPEGEEKIQTLFQAEREYYLALHALVLEQYMRANRREFKIGDEDGFYSFRTTRSERSRDRVVTEKKLTQSRRRSVIRWPKSILLFDDWFDFLLGKTRRAWGVDLRAELTEKELRHPLLYGWKRFFQLKRQGRIK